MHQSTGSLLSLRFMVTYDNGTLSSWDIVVRFMVTDDNGTLGNWVIVISQV